MTICCPSPRSSQGPTWPRLASLVIFLGSFSLLWAQVPLGNVLTGSSHGDQFGHTLSLSGDGQRLAVGIPSDDTNGWDAGAVQVYERQGGSWIALGSPIYGLWPYTYIGNSISLSDDGGYLAVAGFVGSSNNFVAVKVFRFDGNHWSQLGQPIEGKVAADFGRSISLSAYGRRVAIGGPMDNPLVPPEGHVRVYEWKNGQWDQAGSMLTGDNFQDYFGETVALSTDGTRLAVGAGGSDDGGGFSGEVKVFNWDGSDWVQMGSDIVGESAGDQAARLSISDAGDRLAISAILNDGGGTERGHVRVFAWQGSQWTQLGNDLNGSQNNDQWGNCVALSGDGQRVVAGSIRDQGFYRIFQWDQTQWQALNLNLAGAPGDSYGFAADLSYSGGILAIGSPIWDEGHAEVYYLGENYVRGTVRFDTVSNCQADSNEQGVAGIPVRYANAQTEFWQVTDADGHYSMFLDPGTYQATIHPDSTLYPYHTACPSGQSVSIASTGLMPTNADFVLADSISCPYLTVELSTPFIRRCFSNRYTVDYCNRGTLPGYHTRITVELDSHLSYLSSTIPPDTIIGQVIYFDLDTVAVGACGQFQLTVQEDCQSALGEQHCTQASISSDTICSGLSSPISIEPTCQGDTLAFEVADTGPAMDSLIYLIVQDTTMIGAGQLWLGAGLSQRITPFPAHSLAGFQLVVAADDWAWYAATPLTRCDTTPVQQAAFYPPRSPQLPRVAVSCQNNIGSYDPNIKTAQPPGRGPAHYLPPEAPLRYTLQFQNTGTDTAFRVEILDTLATHFDPASLRVISASHPYTFSIQGTTPAGQPILSFLFDPIQLPDSGVNLAASQGFVKFQVAPRPGVTLGTVLSNRAAIYFDFNPPVLTPYAWHTLHRPHDGRRCELQAGRDQVVACQPYTWIDGQTYFTDDSTATHLLAGAARNGCDSLVSLQLQINTVNANVRDSLGYLIADTEAESYQWVDCNQGFMAIQGATQASYLPTQNGLYAVIVAQGGCSDTSACHLVNTLSLAPRPALHRLFPNPTTGAINLEWASVQHKVVLTLYDATGRLHWRKHYDRLEKVELSLPPQEGLYLLEWKSLETPTAWARVWRQ